MKKFLLKKEDLLTLKESSAALSNPVLKSNIVTNDNMVGGFNQIYNQGYTQGYSQLYSQLYSQAYSQGYARGVFEITGNSELNP